MTMSVADAITWVRSGHYTENILVQITNQEVIDDKAAASGDCELASLGLDILCANDGILRISQKNFTGTDGKYYGVIQRISELGTVTSGLLNGVPSGGAGSLDILLDGSRIMNEVLWLDWSRMNFEVRTGAIGTEWTNARPLFKGVVQDSEINDEGRTLSFRVDSLQYYLDEIISSDLKSATTLGGRACFGWCSRHPVVNQGDVSGDSDWVYITTMHVSEDGDFKIWREDDDITSDTAASGSFGVEINGSASSTVTITRSSSTATVSHTSHGFVKGDVIQISGATQTDYNGTFSVTIVDANSYTYSVDNSPTTPATGTIKATDWPISDLVFFEWPLAKVWAASKGYKATTFLENAGEILIQAKALVQTPDETADALVEITFNETSLNAYDTANNKLVGYLFDDFTNHTQTSDTVPPTLTPNYALASFPESNTWRKAFASLIGGTGGVVAFNNDGELTAHYLLGTPTASAVLKISRFDFADYDYQNVPVIEMVELTMDNQFPDGGGDSVIRGDEGYSLRRFSTDQQGITINTPLANTTNANTLGDAYLNRFGDRDYRFSNCLLAKALNVGDIVNFGDDIDDYLGTSVKGWVIGINGGTEPFVDVRT